MKNTIRQHQRLWDLEDGDRERENVDTTSHRLDSVQKMEWMEMGDRKNRPGWYRVEWNIIIRKLNKWIIFPQHPWDSLFKRATAYRSILREHKTNLSSTQSTSKPQAWICKSRIGFVCEGGQNWQQEELCNYIWTRILRLVMIKAAQAHFSQNPLLTQTESRACSPVLFDLEVKGHPVRPFLGPVGFFHHQMEIKSSFWCPFCLKNKKALMTTTIFNLLANDIVFKSLW